MKNTEEASANAVFAQVKKEGEIAAEEEAAAAEEEGEEGEEEEDDEEEEEENTEHRNEMYFFLEEYPEYRISAVGRWRENQKGEVIEDVDTYFLHITRGGRCDSVGECLDRWSEQDEEAEEKWETLCQRIEELDGLEEIICTEESFGL